MRLTLEEKRRLKALASRKDWDATMAYLDVLLEETLEQYTETVTDHRYVQGGYHKLKQFRDAIVAKPE